MAEPNAPQPKGVCDPKAALARLEDHVDVYIDVVTGFLNDDEGYLRRLHEAVESGDGYAAHRTAHTVKGLASMCGAVSAAEACHALEQEAEQAAPSRRRDLLHLIEAEIAAARVGLAAYYRAAK
jgi:HPt (histidine-containing phosphotransfer) domain-containing protein